MKNLISAPLLCAAVGSLLTFGSALSAQIVPSWSSDFSQYSNNAVLANKASYNNSTYNWRLISGNNANMPAATQAVAKNDGSFAYASVTAARNGNSLNARIQARDVGSVPVSATNATYIGGDIRYNGGGTANTNATTAIMFVGENGVGNTIQISMGINFSSTDGLTFYANFNNVQVPSQSVSYNAGAEFAVDPNLWYTFSAEIAPVTGITNLKVLAGNEVVWSIFTNGNIVPVTFSGVEMQVTRPGSTGLRTADFANLTIGTQIPEPATTAALLLLVAFGVTVVVKRRRG